MGQKGKQLLVDVLTSALQSKGGDSLAKILQQEPSALKHIMREAIDSIEETTEDVKPEGAS